MKWARVSAASCYLDNGRGTARVAMFSIHPEGSHSPTPKARAVPVKCLHPQQGLHLTNLTHNRRASLMSSDHWLTLFLVNEDLLHSPRDSKAWYGWAAIDWPLYYYSFWRASAHHPLFCMASLPFLTNINVLIWGFLRVGEVLRGSAVKAAHDTVLLTFWLDKL